MSELLSRRGFLGWTAVGLAGLLVPSRTVVGPSIDIRQPRRWEWPRITHWSAGNSCWGPPQLSRAFSMETRRVHENLFSVERWSLGPGEMMYVTPSWQSIIVMPGDQVGVRFDSSLPGLDVIICGVYPDGERFAVHSAAKEVNTNRFVEFTPFKASSADSSLLG